MKKNLSIISFFILITLISCKKQVIKEYAGEDYSQLPAPDMKIDLAIAKTSLDEANLMLANAIKAKYKTRSQQILSIQGANQVLLDAQHTLGQLQGGSGPIVMTYIDRKARLADYKKKKEDSIQNAKLQIELAKVKRVRDSIKALTDKTIKDKLLKEDKLKELAKEKETKKEVRKLENQPQEVVDPTDAKTE